MTAGACDSREGGGEGEDRLCGQSGDPRGAHRASHRIGALSEAPPPTTTTTTM